MPLFNRWWATNTVLKITGAAVAGALVVGGGTLAAVKSVRTNDSVGVGQDVGTSVNGNSVGANAGASAGKGSVSGSASGNASAGGSSAGASESIGTTVPSLGSIPSPGSLLPTITPLPTFSPLPKPGSLLPSVSPTGLLPSVSPTGLLPSVNPTSLVPSASPTPLPSSSPPPSLGLPIAVPTVGVNGLSPYATGLYSVPVPATPSHTAHLCLGVDNNTQCQDFVVPSEGGMTLSLAFSANTSILAPTFTVNACGTGTGYTLTLAGTTPGTSISATVTGLPPFENGTQSTSKSVLASLCVS